MGLLTKNLMVWERRLKDGIQDRKCGSKGVLNRAHTHPHLSQGDHEVVQLIQRREVKGHEALVEVLVHLGLIRVLVKVLEGRLTLMAPRARGVFMGSHGVHMGSHGV